MSSYIIAGSSNNFDTSECENLSNAIRQYYPDISFKVVLKDSSEWEHYIDEVCRIYGFKQKSNPIVYTMDGKLIGDRNAFVSLAESRFGIQNPKLRQGPVNPDINKKVAKLELDEKLKEKRGKRTQGEKINDNTLKIFALGYVKPCNGFFKQSFVHGMNVILSDLYFDFLFKFEERLCPPFILKEEFKYDESEEKVEESDTVLAEVVNEDGSRSTKQIAMFCENFMTLEYQQYLQQQQQAALDQAKEKEAYSSRQNMSGIDTKAEIKHEQTVNVDPIQEISIVKDDLLKSPGLQLESTPLQEQQILNQSSEQNLQQDQQQQKQEQQQQEGDNVEEVKDEEFRPETAPLKIEETVQPELIQITKYVVHKFRNGYVLAMHPDPLIEGQFLLLRPMVKIDEEGENLLVQDYSRQKRGRYNSFKALMKGSAASQEDSVEGLYNNSLDLFKVLSLEDYGMIVKLINKVDGIAIINILPQTLKSFIALSNGHINLLVRKYAQLQRGNRKLLPYLTDANKKTNNLNVKELLPLEEFVLEQTSRCFEIGKNIYQCKFIAQYSQYYYKIVKGLDVVHYISFPDKLITAEQTLENVTNILQHFFEKYPNAPLKIGFNLIITKNIIFLAPTITNYDKVNGVEVHLPAFTTLGFLNMPLNKLDPSLNKDSSIDYFQLLQRTQVGLSDS